MARLNVDEITELTIEEIIDSYAQEKELETLHKKKAEEFNKKIKDYFIKEGRETYTTDKYVAKLSDSTSYGFDETKLLGIMKALGKSETIKTKEYVDIDVVNALVVKEEIKIDDLKPAQTTKVVKKLTISKVKEKKEDE